jgi:hypothetical protein
MYPAARKKSTDVSEEYITTILRVEEVNVPLDYF